MKKFNLKNEKGIAHIILIIILLIGIAVTVYLVQIQHIFKSRANTPINNAFTVTGSSGCTDDTVVYLKCPSSADKVHIKFNQENISDIESDIKDKTY